MKKIHRILEKTAVYKPYEFAKVNTAALIWQLLSSILITKFCLCLMLTYVWTPRFSFAWKIKSMVFFNNVPFFKTFKYAQSVKKSISSQPLSDAIVFIPM